jgi:hypothetical protein
MWKRFLLVIMLAAFPVVLTGCPDEDDPIEEGLEEIEDEIDDAL